MTRRRTITLLLVLTSLAMAGVAGWYYLHQREPAAFEAPALVQFGEYRSGMSLREAYESLPRAGDGAAGLRLIVDNPTAWAARWRLLQQTQRTLDISYFIVRQDVFGAAFLGHLLHKAKAGVHIRLLIDAQGTVMSFTNARGNDYLDTLANTRHIQLKMFRPLIDRYARALVTLNPVAAVASEHDKILVSDGAHSMIGGRNISAEYFAEPRQRAGNFRDTDLILASPAVARAVTAAFEAQYRSDAAHAVSAEKVDLVSFGEELDLAYQAMDAWLHGVALEGKYARRIDELRLGWQKEVAQYPALRGVLRAKEPQTYEAETRILDSNTRLEMRPDVIAEGLRRLVGSARAEILVQSPYVVLSKEAVALLEAAGRRGVRITIVTNSPLSSDNALSQAFFQEQWPELLARIPGLRIFVAGRPQNLHSKVMVFDDRLSLVGTYNLDPISMGINSEIMAAVWSPAFARAAAAAPVRFIAQGPPMLYEYRIRRDAAGRALRGSDGRPIVAFGPENHSSPEEWRKVQAYWAMLRGAEKFAGFSPIF